MITPDLIIKPFADSASGPNIQTPPQTSPTGFVNFTDGYTSSYEIALASGNPQAKAVERPVQNYLFNALSKNANAWQAQGIPPWYSGMIGGYIKNAQVLRVNGANTFIYRSLADGNVADPVGNPTLWEYVPTAAEALKNVPMPSGGPGGPTAAVISLPIDFNLILSGTFEVKTAAILAASANSPDSPYGVNFGQGMLEAITWDTGAGNMTVQRFTDASGATSVRSGLNGTFTVWLYSASYVDIQSAESISANMAGGPITYTATLSPNPGALFMGMEVRLLVNATSGLNPTLNLNGLGAKPIVGGANLGLKAGELTAGRMVSLIYSLTSGGRWCVSGQSAGPIQIDAATALNHSAQVDQVQHDSYNYAPDTNSGSAANQYGAVYVPAVATITPGLTLRFSAQTTNTAAATFGPNGIAVKQILDLNHAPLLPGAIIAGGVCQVIFSVPLDAWILQYSTGVAAVAQATETKLGLAELATQAETDAGVDDLRIVTPKKLRWGVRFSAGINGYLALPSWMGGFILQWGTTPNISAGGNLQVGMNTPFLVSSLCAVCMAQYSSSPNSGYMISIYGRTLTYMLFYNSNTAVANSATWFAIGV